MISPSMPRKSPRRHTYWRDRTGTQLQVLGVRNGVVRWRYVPTPLEHHTTPVADWHQMQRVWIGGERDFPGGKLMKDFEKRGTPLGP